jgi:Cytosol aminopeptidase family, N-terminal domain
MSVTLSVGVEVSRLPHVETDVLVAPFFADDRPLRGPAAWADWRLCGLLDDALAEGRLPSRLGEATLAPSAGRLAARRLLMISLGERAALGFAELRAAATRAAERLAALRAGDVAFAVPGQALTGIVPELAAELVVEAFADALARTPRALRLRLVLSEEDAGPALAALRALPTELAGGRVALRIERAIEARQPGPPGRKPVAQPQSSRPIRPASPRP